MKKTRLFLVILWLGSSGALGQSLWGFGHDRYIERDGFSKKDWPKVASLRNYFPAQGPAETLARIDLATMGRIPGFLGPHKTIHGIGEGNRCEGNNGSSSSSRQSRGIGDLQLGLDLEEYLRNAKLKEKEKIKARQPAPPPPGLNNKALLWLAVGSGGALLAIGIILWLIFRIKIPPCPKCQNADKKTLRTGDMCRTPTSFWVKCYCDACGYKWIQKGRRA